jgi:hypothetical protein
MKEDPQVKYHGYTLIGVPEDAREKLKVVDSDGDLGIVVSNVIITYPNSPNRTIYITIDWARKGIIRKEHWESCWITVGKDPAMARRYTEPPQQQPTTVPKKVKISFGKRLYSWYLSMKKKFT